MTAFRRHLRVRPVLVALLVPLLLFASVTPAHGIFGAITGLAQRAVMIANQVTMLARHATMVTHLRSQADDLDDQLTHLRDQALGEVGQLADAFESLSSDPASLLTGGALAWASDFSGPALPYVQAIASMGGSGNALTNQWRQELAAADVVGAADIQALFTQPAVGLAAVADWRDRREVADRQRVYDYAAFDAAERLVEVLGPAQSSFDGLRGQTNLSSTALQQAQVSSQLTEGEIEIAQAQLAAYTSIREAVERQDDELLRRRDLDQWVAAERTADQLVTQAQAANAARSQGYRDALLLPEAHGGN